MDEICDICLNILKLWHIWGQANSFLVGYLSFSNEFENHGYTSEPGVWFFWEQQLWTLRIILIPGEGVSVWGWFIDLLPYWVLMPYSGALKKSDIILRKI